MNSSPAVASRSASRLRRWFAKLVALMASLVISHLAYGDAIVTLCASFDQPGSGTNLQTALQAPLNQQNLINTITFRCPVPTTIAIPIVVSVSQSTTIDGQNAISLVTNTVPTMFDVMNQGVFFTLKNVTLRNTEQTPPLNCPLQHDCAGRILHAQGHVALDNVNIDSTGNAIGATAGQLSITGSTFQNNPGTSGPKIAGIVTLVGAPNVSITLSTFASNASTRPIIAFGGTLQLSSDSFVGNMASVLDNSQLSIDHSQFSENNNDGALIISGPTTIANSTFTNNSSANGGAIQFTGPPGLAPVKVTIRATTFSGNKALGSGGAIYIASSGSLVFGVTLGHTVFTNNSAVNGGAIATALLASSPPNTPSQLNLQTVVFTGNSATSNGGGVYLAEGACNIARGVFNGNKAAANGGAIAMPSQKPEPSVIANALFVNNSAQRASALGGGDVSLINSTVYANAGIALDAGVSGAQTKIGLSNSIVANNTGGNCNTQLSLTDQGHNLQFPDGSCGHTIPVADPHLDSMYIPLPKSPPMGAADPHVCSAAPVSGRDVFGIGRLTGGGCTIGAAEGPIETLINQYCIKFAGRTTCH